MTAIAPKAATPDRDVMRKPQAVRLETPCAFAERVGREVSNRKSDADRKEFGIFLTPEAVARFMALQIVSGQRNVRLLDPAAGVGILTCAAVEELVGRGGADEIEIVAHEIDNELADGLENVLTKLTAWAKARGVEVRYEIRRGDFILTECISLGLLASIAEDDKFDVVIGNPPYFKVGKNDPRANAASEVVYGQPNIYGIFMAASAALLKTDGQMIFITPRSFASGPYFSRFRQWFFDRIRPTFVHVFDSRRDAFGRDEVLQENVIFAGVQNGGWEKRDRAFSMVVSSSHGIGDVGGARMISRNLGDMIAGKDRILRIPASADEETALEHVENWKGSLAAYGMKISTGPVVAFRATEWLRKEAADDAVPLMWLTHVFSMEMRWPNGGRKQEYIDSRAASQKLLLANKNYVAMRRFSAKEDARRLTAAPMLAESVPGELVGLENHLNYVYRPGASLSIDECWGLAALYSSSLLDAYFRCVSGNTQVSATELRTMPLPPLEQIVELGSRVRMEGEPMKAVDRLVKELIEG